MSLFIGGLAFEHVGGDAESYIMTHRLGILCGSLIAGLLGYFILLTAPKKIAAATVEVEEPVGEIEKESDA
jgi:NhaA family Na+:H+ antiporter